MKKSKLSNYLIYTLILLSFIVDASQSWSQKQAIPPIGITKKQADTPVLNIQNEVSKLLNIPLYHDSLQDGTNFISVFFPSPAFASENLLFSTLDFDSIISSTLQLRNAYLFANFVNQVVDPSNTLRTLSDLTILQEAESKASQQILTSPDNNGAFYLSIVAPYPLTNNTWIKYENTKMELDTIFIDTTETVVAIPYFFLSLSINRLKIVRPWFSPIPPPTKVDKYRSKEESPLARAYLSEIIICKNLKMERYQEQSYTVHFDEDSDIPKISIIPNERIETSEICILGGIYTLYKH